MRENFCDNCGRIWTGFPEPVVGGDFVACCRKCARELRAPYEGLSDREERAAERRQMGITE